MASLGMNELLDLLERATGRRVGPDDELLDAGILDSLGLLTLLEALEDRGVALHPASLPRQALSTARRILAEIERA